ncbi:MAG: winged helix-turn-helix domain-containing protein [Proteobacteria bacterium]|nr:winged helix-turn-helix domain-containing protein [Pseudomonadota bacterium]
MDTSGEEIAVEPQVFALLQFLIENCDRVVSKDEIIEHVWDGRIVSDGTLNSRINSARRAVGDDGKAQAVIKTFPRRGFRFVAALSKDDDIAPAPTSVSDKPSIAVLPFHNLSNDPEQEYFSDGITEDIITALSRIRQFFIIARNTTFTYKGKAVDVQTVAKDLGVRYVLEGSVRKVGDRVRISAQLIDGDTGNHIWAERYDRELEDIFEVQDDITQTVVGAIEPEMAEAERERAKSKPSENLAAWDLYQRGSAFIWARDKHGNREEIQSAKNTFESVIELDPNFSDAYAGLANCYCYSLVLGHSDNREEDSDKGLSVARRAVALASDNALAQHALGFIHVARGEHDLAIHHFNASLDINPSGLLARNGLVMALVWSGKPEQAIHHLEMCLRLSPHDPVLGPTLVRFAEAYFQLGDYEISVEYATKALRRPETQIWGNCALVSALAHLEKLDEAQKALSELLQRRSDFSISLVRKSIPITDREFLETYIDGLRKAGLPE